MPQLSCLPEAAACQLRCPTRPPPSAAHPARARALALSPPLRCCSCYANSLLQALLATPSLAAYLVSGAAPQLCAGLLGPAKLPLIPGLHVSLGQPDSRTQAACDAMGAVLSDSAGEHGRGCIKPGPSDWCVLCELEKLAQQAYREGSDSGVLNPRPLVSSRASLCMLGNT